MTRVRRRNAVIGTVVIAVATLAATLAVQSDSTTPAASSSSSTSTTITIEPTTTEVTTTTVLDPSKLGDEGQEIYRLVLAGRGTQYHVRFKLTGSSVPASATSATLEVWRSGVQIRQDTSFQQADGINHAVDIGGPDGSVSCQEQPGVALTCHKTSSIPVPPTDDFLSTVMGQLTGASITARDDTVDGIAARCFVLDAGDATKHAEICLSAKGAPLRLNVTGLAAEAVETFEEVDREVFTPPAPAIDQTSTSVITPTT